MEDGILNEINKIVDYRKKISYSFDFKESLNCFKGSVPENCMKFFKLFFAFLFYGAISVFGIIFSAFFQYIKIFGLEHEPSVGAIGFLIFTNIILSGFIWFFFAPMLIANFWEKNKFKEFFNFTLFFKLFSNVKLDYTLVVSFSFFVFCALFVFYIIAISLLDTIIPHLTLVALLIAIFPLLYFSKIFAEIYSKALEIEDIKNDQGFINANHKVLETLKNGVCDLENTSGFGRYSIVPKEVDKWNWNGFLTPGLWAIGNKTWLALCALVPIYGFFMYFVIGVKGNKWAWQNQRWESVEQFHQTQKRWVLFGFLFSIFRTFITLIFASGVIYFCVEIIKGAKNG